MKTKQIWTLLVILAVLGAGTFLRQIQKPAELSVEEFTPLDLSFDEAQIAKIVLERNWEEHDGVKPSQKAEIVKTPAGWKLPGLFNVPANETKITEFLRQIREAKGEQRASGKSFYQDFGISDQESFKVSLYLENGSPVLEFFLGLKTTGAAYFLRKINSEVIYLTETNFLAQMGIYGDPAKDNLEPDPWAAMDFLKLDSSKVRGVEIKDFEKGRENIKTSLEFSDQWKFKKTGVSADGQKVKDFVAGLAGWNAEKVVDAASKDFTKPLWQMTVLLDGGQTQTFTAVAGDEKTEAVFIQVSGQTVAYQLSKYYFENLNKDDAYFAIPPSTPKPEPAAAK